MPVETVVTEHRVRRLPSLEDRVFRNFYLSYKFSQGNPRLQWNLMTAVAKMYPEEEFRQEFRTSDVLSTKIKALSKKLRLPTWHTTRKDSSPTVDGDAEPIRGIEEDFQRHLENQLDILSYLQFGNRAQRDDSNFYGKDDEEDVTNILGYTRETLLSEIILGMTEKDLNYLNHGRQRKLDREDRYESHIKKYIVDGTPSGSIEFDRLFEEMRDVIEQLLFSSEEPSLIPDGEKQKTRLEALGRYWEIRHPDEFFISLQE